MYLKNGTILQGKSFTKGDLTFGTTISEIRPAGSGEGIDVSGCYVVPGFVDIHTHGAMGEDFSDGYPDGLPTLSRYYADHGVTSYLGTTMTLKEETLLPAMRTLRAGGKQKYAKLAGIHLEGPFLSFAKRGAQAAENLHKPDVALFHRLNEASGGMIKLVTVACEEEGAMDFIETASRECTVSLGHSTADYDTALEAFRRGASHATHLFNGMPPLHHRDPGIIGAALTAGASVELICDGYHIHPAVVLATYRMFGEKLNLISDSLRCAGMPDGPYELGGQPIELKDGLARLLDGTIAGSSISLLDAVRNVVNFGLPLADAFYAASTAPAQAAGLADIGSLEVGKAADLLVLDDQLNLKAVFVDGRQVKGDKL